ncbi:hypothetical protein HMF8227_01410 [Saliniradius amylolyticus]|uniref:Uncharacterized protein n=1 Tax=Saliniradius amylolyticus TaxID=2183582 RepID=A0A2S2E2L4_9ALTE|nr:hypothetical protein [Saliniradius amylolyticus]AWL11885.1 hypothetical protein HMF8227_01410 [Saliniradius amylolyticus]
MKSLIDIHVVLATQDDMQFWDEEAEDAADRLNEMLHYLYQQVDEDIPVPRLELMLQKVWENWHQDPHLIDSDVTELFDWVDHMLATWEDDDSDNLNHQPEP